MKVFDNIEKLDIPEDEKKELTKHVLNLTAIRKDRKATEKYVYAMLSTDTLLRIWKEDRALIAINGLLDQYPEYKKFNPPAGSIQVDKAKTFRELLLSVIEDDKISFGHLYHILGCEQNRKGKNVLYECIFDNNEIEYAVDFDPEEITKQAEEIKDLQERLVFLNKKKRESELYSYNGVVKSKVNSILDNCKQEISETISMFGYNGSNANQVQPKVKIQPQRPFGMNYSEDQLREIYERIKSYVKGTGLTDWMDVMNGKIDRPINWTEEPGTLYSFIIYYSNYVRPVKTKSGIAKASRDCLRNKNGETTQPGIKEIRRVFLLKGSRIKELNRSHVRIYREEFDDIFNTINHINSL